MGNKGNQAQDAIRTYKKVQEKAKSMYGYDKNGNKILTDIQVSGEVRKEAYQAIGKQETMLVGLEKKSKKRSEYLQRTQELEKIAKEAEENCKKKKLF